MHLGIFLMSAIATAVGMIVGYWIHKTLNPFAYQKMYYYIDSRWLDVNKHPIPDDTEDFLSYDGEQVKYIYSLSYNKFGKPVCMNLKPVVFWMPMPKYELTVKPKKDIDNLNFRMGVE